MCDKNTVFRRSHVKCQHTSETNNCYKEVPSKSVEATALGGGTRPGLEQVGGHDPSKCVALTYTDLELGAHGVYGDSVLPK